MNVISKYDACKKSVHQVAMDWSPVRRLRALAKAALVLLLAVTAPAAPAVAEEAVQAAAAGARKVVFAPYFESYRPHDLRKVPSSAVTLAFLLGTPAKQLAWDGTMPLTEWRTRARASGKTIVLSFGGAAGSELASVQRDTVQLAEAYLAAARMYGAKRLDFDIEGAGITDTDTVTRRNRALRLVQNQLPGIALQYTLPVMPFGLDASCLALLRDAKRCGVAIDTVNVMAMDYGGSFLGDMGKYALQAARAVRQQLVELGMPGVGVGITPMIGHNDVQGEVFTLEDARQVAEFAARTPWVDFVGFWAAGRDNGRKSTLGESSMLAQRDWDFTRTFAAKLG